jgi:hypothetical protein
MADSFEVRLNSFDIRRLSVRFATKKVEQVTKDIAILARLESRGPYSTGRTAASIHSVVWVTGSTVRGTVRAGTPYAHIAHSGASPHIITPRGTGYPLQFYWRKVGRVVRFPYVHHPGQPGKHFLTGPAERVGRRNRFIVVTYE